MGSLGLVTSRIVLALKRERVKPFEPNRHKLAIEHMEEFGPLGRSIKATG